jgi:hypothetical protein
MIVLGLLSRLALNAAGAEGLLDRPELNAMITSDVDGRISMWCP